MPLDKSAKNESNDIFRMGNFEGKDTKSFIDKIMGDVSKTSATKQVIIGASSGWLTGFLAIRMGKVIAIAMGSGIILLQIANEKGYIKINWERVNKKIDGVVDTIEEKVTGDKPSLTDKAGRFVDRKLDKAEETLRNQKRKAKHWYSSLAGTSQCHLKEIHIFLVSFVAGVAVGIATS